MRFNSAGMADETPITEDNVNADVCIITGGAGFIGTAISPGLVARFALVIIIDNLHPQIHRIRERPGALPARVEFLQADITESRTWDELLPGLKPAVIIHLAAETGTGQSLTESVRHSHTNVCGTAAMLDALVRHDAIPKRIVLCSSRAIYGEGAWRSLDERSTIYPGQRSLEQLRRADWDFPNALALPSRAATTSPAPVSVYGATKLAQEHLLAAWAASFGTKLTILRLQNVYGPGQSLINSATGILPWFCRLARRGISIPLYEDGEMLRDFVLIDDVAAAILLAVDQNAAPSQTCDVGTGKATTIAAIARRIAALHGAPAPQVSGKFRHGDVRHASCTIEDTTACLGWTPRYSTDQGLQRLIAWVDSQLLEDKVMQETLMP